jgi:hypothetical protein
MKAYALRLEKIEYLNEVKKENFFSASNANVISKLFVYLMEQGIRSNGEPVKVGNMTMASDFHASERAIQYALDLFEELDLITRIYDKERTSKLASEGGRNVGNRLGIQVNLNEFLQYVNYTRYDAQYKEAKKRGWFRRLVNQLPIRIMGFFKHELKKAQRQADIAKIEDIRKRESHFKKYIKATVKRHKRYMLKEIIQEASIDYTAVYEAIQNCGMRDLHLKTVIPWEVLLAAQPIPVKATN